MAYFDILRASWIYEPKQHTESNSEIRIQTDPGTDFWQRTYYGFQNDNAPALLLPTDERYFSFTVRTDFDSKTQFDQCGVILYEDSDNWFKASIEYENEEYQRLGSVVTNNGYSDWATTDIDASIKHMVYRLSRRESDFCVETSVDGDVFKQMRIFHLCAGAGTVHFGVYACSPSQSSFTARFTEMQVTECLWHAHGE